MDCRQDLLGIYERMNARFGNLRWWPADGPFEVMVGAILTQNTAWTNAEKAIGSLRERGLLSPAALSRIGEEALAGIVRPSGFFRIKARRLKTFVRFFLEEFGGSAEEMSKIETGLLREKLLGVPGVGPETADSILLYACEKPSFVSDAYTRRILLRHRLIPETADYEWIRNLFMENLPPDVPLFNQFHALFVQTGKEFCGRTPRCVPCPLGESRPETGAL